MIDFDAHRFFFTGFITPTSWTAAKMWLTPIAFPPPIEIVVRPMIDRKPLEKHLTSAGLTLG